MIRELQATRKDYEAYIKCKFKAGISKKIGEPGENIITDEGMGTSDFQYIGSIPQTNEPDTAAMIPFL